MRKQLSLIFAALLVISLFSSCRSKAVKNKEVSPVLTQTKVVLDKLPAEKEEYLEFFGTARPVFFTPGLYEGFVPQGLCYCAENGLVIISGYYPESLYASRLAVVDNRTGELVLSVGLLDVDGESFFGHVGGVACSENTLFITCGGFAYYVSLSALKNAENNSDIKFEGSFKLETLGSFANCEDGVLWIGDFVENKKSQKESAKNITTLKSGETLYARCDGYKLVKGKPDEGRENGDGGYVPDCILAVPLQIQGMTRLFDGRFVFSCSYGRKNDSKLLICEDIFLEEPYETRAVQGFSVPVFCFAEDTVLKEYNAVPMSQGIDRVDDKLFLLFESGSDIYRNGGGKYPNDYVMELDIP